MRNNLITILCFFILISFVFGEFELMKRSRGYTEAVDYLTIKIKQTTCEEFLKKGGLAEKIRGGHSHHCLPIDSKGKDADDFKFVGRCLNSDKDIILSIFDVKNKRQIEHQKTKADEKKHRSFMSVRKDYDEEADTEFYLTLKSGDKPLEFKIKNFSLKNGHAYQVRRPKCLKARNFCKKKDTKEETMVIDCVSKKELDGKVDKDSRVYIEITKRDSRPDTCSDRKNGYCCRYVNANPKGGICKMYKRNSYNDGDKKESQGKESLEKPESQKNDNKSVDEEEELIPVKSNDSLESILKDMGLNAEGLEESKDSKKESNTKSSEKDEKKQTDSGKEKETEEDGEEFDGGNEVEKKAVDSNSIPVETKNGENKKDVSQQNQEKRQFEDEEPEFDIFEDEEQEKKNVVDQPKPRVENFERFDGPNSFVIPNLKKKKNEHKLTVKSVEQPVEDIKPVRTIDTIVLKPVDILKPVEQPKLIDLVKPIQQESAKNEQPVAVASEQTPQQKI